MNFQKKIQFCRQGIIQILNVQDVYQNESKPERVIFARFTYCIITTSQKHTARGYKKTLWFVFNHNLSIS